MFDITTLTGFHTIMSFIGLGAGIVVVIGLFGSQRLALWTAIYFVTAFLTSATGFLFKDVPFGASHWVGVLSLVALALAILARWAFGLAGMWRLVYAVGAVLGVYFLVFVAIAQAFKKIPSLQAMAPTLSEQPFAIAQVGALVVFVAIGIAAARAFRPGIAFGAS